METFLQKIGKAGVPVSRNYILFWIVSSPAAKSESLGLGQFSPSVEHRLSILGLNITFWST